MLWADKQKPDRGAGLLRGRAGRSRIPSFAAGVVCRGRRPPLGVTCAPADWFRAAGTKTPRQPGLGPPRRSGPPTGRREGVTRAGMRAVSQALGRAVTHVAAGCRRCSTLRYRGSGSHWPLRRLLPRSTAPSRTPRTRHRRGSHQRLAHQHCSGHSVGVPVVQSPFSQHRPSPDPGHTPPQGLPPETRTSAQWQLFVCRL
jgi:hypothetical protein